MARAHASYEDLKMELLEFSEEIGVGSQYAHYKYPHVLYKVLGLVVLEAEDVIAVRYSPIEEPAIEFIRPYFEWDEMVERDGQSVHRFTKVENSSQSS